MVGAKAFDGKEESMETLKFNKVGIDISRRSRNMGDAAAKVFGMENGCLQAARQQ